MRGRLLTVGLLALILQGCGDGGTSNSGAAASPPAGAQEVALPSATQQASPSSTSKRRQPAPAGKPAAASKPAAAAPLKASFVAAAKPGRAPAVIVAGSPATTAGEVQHLAGLGIATLTVPDNATVADLRAAVAALKGRADVDASRVALVAEGPAATAAARLLGSMPLLRGATLINAEAGAAQAMHGINGPMVLLQSSTKADTATAKTLVAAGPPGTLMQEFVQLGDAARAARDRWLAGNLH